MPVRALYDDNFLQVPSYISFMIALSFYSALIGLKQNLFKFRFSLEKFFFL